MKRFMCAATLVAGLLAASAGSAAVLVYPGGTPPSPANKVVTADIYKNVSVTLTEILAPGDTAQFVYTAQDNLRFSIVSTSGTGANNGLDLANIRFGFSNPPTTAFSSIVPVGGGTAFGGGSLPGGVLNKGDVLTIYWSDGVLDPVPVSASFTTSAVPVPAALPLLLGALGALGLAGRRLRK